MASILKDLAESLEETTYVGYRQENTDAKVVVIHRGGVIIVLNPCLDRISHSPDGFEWGYEGSGPAQLAFAMLTHATGSVTAQKYYQQFKRAKIAPISQRCSLWRMTRASVIEWLKEQGWVDLGEEI